LYLGGLIRVKEWGINNITSRVFLYLTDTPVYNKRYLNIIVIISLKKVYKSKENIA